MSCDYPEFFRDTLVRAKKEHVCCSCGITIPVGQQYVYIVGKWDDFDVIKMCLFCKSESDILDEPAAFIDTLEAAHEEGSLDRFDPNLKDEIKKYNEEEGGVK